MADDPYSRLYWRLSDEYPEVWDDPKVLGTYVQLLTAADGAWPSHPHMLAYVEDDAVAVLTGCGLLITTGKRFTIRGLDKERKRRRSNARRGAAAKWAHADADAVADADAHALADAVAHASASKSQSERRPNGNAIGMPSRAEPSQDEPRRDKPRRTARASKTQGKSGLVPLSDILKQGRTS